MSAAAVEQQVRPHIERVRGIWHCGSLIHIDARGTFVFQLRVGYGYTPGDAYRDWLRAIGRAP